MLAARRLVYLLLAAPLLAQSVRVVSEFQRVDPSGEIVASDRTPQPREILSPAVARNAFASFHIAVSVPEREPYFLYVQTNPQNIFQLSLYEELYTKTSAGWIPDALEPSKLPAFGILPYLPAPIPGQTTVSYWLDVWVPAETPVGRVRLEVLVKIERGWLMYPMEVRVTPAVIRANSAHSAALPPVSARADASVYGPFRSFLCNTRETAAAQKLSARQLIRRNALQDLALARSLAAARHGDLKTEILQRFGPADRRAWCQSPFPTAALPTEWFLRVRDFLYRQPGPPPD